MKAEIAIYRQDNCLNIVLLEDGQAVEWLCDADKTTIRRQDIILGKVTQVSAALASVFIDIGDSHDAILPLTEAPAKVKAGQQLIVQIRRLTADSKGHQATTRIRLAGPFAVYNPKGKSKPRSRLTAFDAAHQQAFFTADLQRLEQTWRQIDEQAVSGPVPRVLIPLGEPLHAALLRLITAETVKIRVEGEELFSRVYNLVQDLMPIYTPLLDLHVPRGGYGLAAVLGLGTLPDEVSRRKIWLKSGGFIVIDPTEAMTVIDVNSGKDTRGGENDALRLRTNCEAAAEIARQLRLRNTGGCIVIDFLNMASEEDQGKVVETMRQSLARDKAKSRIYGFTSMGLLEMTRSDR